MSVPDVPAVPAVRLPWREELAQSLFGIWAVSGLFLDGWAHANDKPETFFSPWHGVLYSGALAGIAYGLMAQRRFGMFDYAGQRVTVIGMVLFVVGGASDMVWHQVFGIEVGIEALLSPTHLLLMTGGILALTGPFRSAWLGDGDDRPSFRNFLPPLLSLTLAVAVAAFFWMYLWPFVSGSYGLDGPSGAGELADLHHIRGIAGVVVATVLLVTPVLLALRRWRPPFGACTVLFGGVALATSAMGEFWQGPTAAAAVVGGLTADVLIARGARARTVGWVVPAVMWPAFFALFDMAEGVGWSLELWLGTVTMAALVGAGLSLLTEEVGARAPHPVA